MRGDRDANRLFRDNFLSIVTLLTLRRPLYQAMLGGLAATALLCHMRPIAAFGQSIKVFTNGGSLSVLVSNYLITYLQRMLEAKNLLKLAQEDLDGVFHNRRINAAGSALFIGLLPSAAAMVLCGGIVEDATEGFLKPKEQAFVATWFRLQELRQMLFGAFGPGLLLNTFLVFVLKEFIAYAGMLKEIPRTLPSLPTLLIYYLPFCFLWAVLSAAQMGLLRWGRPWRSPPWIEAFPLWLF